ncbi:Hypp5526 [Branchiostoma lanceolatum]|uniref:Hypp5526 protein n=1 Tax=Branchiostoma lanceolatum TaxID=7740 RepID=A0A8J9VI16_BRALA|nr:Hypp5526 [Branchiostoma lanceolatum]
MKSRVATTSHPCWNNEEGSDCRISEKSTSQSSYKTNITVMMADASTNAGNGSSSEVWDLLCKHRSKIIESLKSDVERLIRFLFQEEVLADEENDTIGQEVTLEEKASTLLSLLQTKGNADFLKFCQALNAFGKESIVALLKGTAAGDIFNPIQNVTRPVKQFFMTSDFIAVEQAVQINHAYTYTDKPVTVLHGPSGSGKTQICRSLEEKFLQHYSTAVAWTLDGRNQDRFLKSKLNLLKALKVDLDNTSIVDKCLQKAFLRRETPVFLVVEDLEDGSMVTQDLIPLTMQFRMVIITHKDPDHLQLPEEVHSRSSYTKINGFQGGEELERFLKERLPQHEYQFERKDVQGLNDLFNGNPLALAIVAEYICRNRISPGNCIDMMKYERMAKRIQRSSKKEWLHQHYDKFEKGKLHPAIQVAVDKLARQEQVATGPEETSFPSPQESTVPSTHVPSSEIAGQQEQEEQPAEEPEPAREASAPSSSGTGVKPSVGRKPSRETTGELQEKQSACQEHGNTMVSQQPNEEVNHDSPCNRQDHPKEKIKSIGDSCASSQNTHMQAETEGEEPPSTIKDQPTQQGSLQDGMKIQGALYGKKEGKEQHLAQQLHPARETSSPESSEGISSRRGEKKPSRRGIHGAVAEGRNTKKKRLGNTRHQPGNSKSKMKRSAVSDKEQVDDMAYEATAQPTQEKETKKHSASAMMQTPQKRRKEKKNSKHPRGFDEHVNRMSASRQDRKSKEGSEHNRINGMRTYSAKSEEGKRISATSSQEGDIMKHSKNDTVCSSTGKVNTKPDSLVQKPLSKLQTLRQKQSEDTVSVNENYSKTLRARGVGPSAPRSHTVEEGGDDIQGDNSFRETKCERESNADKRNVPPDKEIPPTTKVSDSPPTSISDNKGTGTFPKSFGYFQGDRDKSYDELQFSRPPEERDKLVDESSNPDSTESPDDVKGVKKDASTSTENGHLIVEPKDDPVLVEYPPSGPPALIHLETESHPRCNLTDVSVRTDLYHPEGEESPGIYYDVTGAGDVQYGQTGPVYAVPYTSLGEQAPIIHGPAGIIPYWLPEWMIGACGTEDVEERNLYLGAAEAVGLSGRQPNDGDDQQCQLLNGTDHPEDFDVDSLQESLFLEANNWVVPQPQPPELNEPDPVFVKVLNTAGQIVTEVRIIVSTYVEDLALYVAEQVFANQPLVGFTLRWQGGFNIQPLTLLQQDVTLQVHHAPDEDQTWVGGVEHLMMVLKGDKDEVNQQTKGGVTMASQQETGNGSPKNDQSMQVSQAPQLGAQESGTDTSVTMGLDKDYKPDEMDPKSSVAQPKMSITKEEKLISLRQKSEAEIEYVHLPIEDPTEEPPNKEDMPVPLDEPCGSKHQQSSADFEKKLEGSESTDCPSTPTDKDVEESQAEDWKDTTKYKDRKETIEHEDGKENTEHTGGNEITQHKDDEENKEVEERFSGGLACEVEGSATRNTTGSDEEVETVPGPSPCDDVSSQEDSLPVSIEEQAPSLTKENDFSSSKGRVVNASVQTEEETTLLHKETQASAEAEIVTEHLPAKEDDAVGSEDTTEKATADQTTKKEEKVVPREVPKSYAEVLKSGDISVPSSPPKQQKGSHLKEKKKSAGHSSPKVKKFNLKAKQRPQMSPPPTAPTRSSAPQQTLDEEGFQVVKYRRSTKESLLSKSTRAEIGQKEKKVDSNDVNPFSVLMVNAENLQESENISDIDDNAVSDTEEPGRKELGESRSATRMTRGQKKREKRKSAQRKKKNISREEERQTRSRRKPSSSTIGTGGTPSLQGSAPRQQMDELRKEESAGCDETSGILTMEP